MRTNLSANSFSPLNLKTGDLNTDGKDEIVLGGSYGAEVFVADTLLPFTAKTERVIIQMTWDMRLTF